MSTYVQWRASATHIPNHKYRPTSKPRRKGSVRRSAPSPTPPYRDRCGSSAKLEMVPFDTCPFALHPAQKGSRTAGRLLGPIRDIRMVASEYRPPLEQVPQ